MASGMPREISGGITAFFRWFISVDCRGSPSHFAIVFSGIHENTTIDITQLIGTIAFSQLHSK
jgi:hypothetical protein